MKCPVCGFENPQEFRFCGSCGSVLGGTCPACGAEVPEGFRFCGSCGHPLAEAPTESVPKMRAERRPVTVLFADLVGFSTLAEHMDPEKLQELMEETFAELTAQVEKREGVVEKFIGDAIVAIFGAPVAHEDDPVRAVEVAMAMLDAVGRRSEAASAPLELRVGVNSGLVVAGGVGDGTQTGVMGDAVNVAARLQQGAERGQILVSDSVWRRVRQRFAGEGVGRIDVKGRQQMIEAHRILGVLGEGERRRAPFVGRRDELSLLELLWSSAVKGNTHVVSLVGEPGVGKSRLLAEFPRREGALDVRVACGSERAFGPFLDLIGSLLGRLPRDLAELERLAWEAGIEGEAARPLAAFMGLAGAPPAVRMADEQRNKQVFAGVWQFLLSAAEGRPALIVLDDVHWADTSTLELLGFLLERLGGVSLMLVLAYRPGFDRVERGTLRASHTGIRLEPLSAEESVELARGFLRVTELPADLELLVASRAEGNPFFVEELLQALLELGSLRAEGGRASLEEVAMDIPDTVQGTILARVDRLGASERTALQHAAVIGRTFDAGLLEAVTENGDLGTALEGLAGAQLLVPHGPRTWAFKHALIQEVAYETLLLRQRKDLHRRVAEALEARAPDDPSFLEALAGHYAKADVPEKARRYGIEAGDLAAARTGFVEAAARYRAALGLWGEGEEEGRLELLEKLGYAALLAGDVAAARTALVEAEAGWRSLGNPSRAGAPLASLGRVYWAMGEPDRGVEVLRRAVETLEPGGPSPELVQAFAWISALNMLIGEVDEGRRLATEGLSMAEALGLEATESHLLNTLGTCEVFEGDPAGIDRIRRALELAELTGEAEALGRAFVNLPATLSTFSYNSEGVALCRRGREVMRRLGAPQIEWFIAGNEAAMLALLGEYEAAESILREMLGGQRAVLGAPGLVNAGMGLSIVLVRRGRFEEVRELLDEIMPVARRIGGTEYLAPALLHEAELESARGNMAAARQSVGEAVDLAFATPSVAHWFQVLPTAARLLPAAALAGLVERCGERVKHRSQEASLKEARGWVDGEPGAFADAAELYASFELPYEEARCRLEAGDLDHAAEIVERFGLGKGPLGARLRVLTA